ncbi:MAG: multidrug efflux SMR transporter [Pirellulales bacterium]|nr:multidrug efflux SMR transporter [Pirellulales bacterium]
MTPALWLALAILLEVTGTTCMKLSNGFRVFWPSAGTLLCYVLSFQCLSLSLRKIELSIAYAIWAGVGTALVAAIGVVLFRETLTPLKLVSIVLVVAGVAGLNLAGNAH